MIKVVNTNKLERANDKKSLYSLLTKTGTYEVRDPYILFKPEETQSKAFTAGYATIYPGCRTGGHTHDDVEEIYHIVRGKGNMKIGDEVFEVSAGDTFVVPLYKFHSTENTGNTPLEMFWVLVKVDKSE